MTVKSKEQIEFEKTLRRCPFCRQKARLGYIRDGAVIECTQCGAKGPPAFHGPLDIPKTWIRARDAWNAWTNEPAIPSDATIAAAAEEMHRSRAGLRYTAGDPDGGSD